MRLGFHILITSLHKEFLDITNLICKVHCFFHRFCFGLLGRELLQQSYIHLFEQLGFLSRGVVLNEILEEILEWFATQVSDQITILFFFGLVFQNYIHLHVEEFVGIFFAIKVVLEFIRGSHGPAGGTNVMGVFLRV